MKVSELIIAFGSRSKLADSLGVSKQAISKWQKADKVPAARAIQIEHITEGQISANQLRPDLCEHNVA